MARMRSLHRLDLADTWGVKFPDDFSKLSSLLELRMDTPRIELDPYMSSVPVLPSTLIQLDVWTFISLPDVSNLKELEELSLENCNSELPDLSNMKKLRKLSLTRCFNVEEIHGFEGLESLEEVVSATEQQINRVLESVNAEKIEMEIYGLEGIESLEELEVCYCNKLTELLGLLKLKNLRILKIESCEKVPDGEEDEEVGKEAYFLRRSDADKAEEVDDLDEEDEEVDEEEESSEDNQYAEESLEEGKDRAVCCLSCLGF
ncbi:hypothetical protein NE237_000287 [Protea cynaroides]|uniref:Uncharacterized protein n=1 Tax=Protea cynaroides TaxID=273540 RepID=A0A9Q0KRR2_9MAGN|nr:hypothetical protein NE237_000287 [Protea cynaroides]